VEGKRDKKRKGREGKEFKQEEREGEGRKVGRRTA
tara:strand:+ start:834 stop:938 length:105 start_codon:yes stop_codon:yes gene_type:complete